MKRIIIAIMLLCLIIGLVFLGSWGLQVYRDVQSMMDLAQQAQKLSGAGLKTENFPQVVELASHTVVSTGNLQKDLQPLFPFFKKLDALPSVGPYLGSIEPGLDCISNLSQAGVILGEIGMPFLKNEESPDSSQKLPQKIVALLVEKKSLLAAAEVLIKKADAARVRIDSRAIPEKYRKDFETTSAIFPKVETAFQVLPLLPGLLGSPKPQTYLVMVQNRDELRATGGFISAFGLLKVSSGKITKLDIEDSTSERLSYVTELRPPPAPLAYLMMTNFLVPRDANWSPDFPTAARQTQEIYSLSTNLSTDGVIAFDQGLIVNLLDFLGPVSLPGDIPEINSDNIEDTMIQYKDTANLEGNSEGRKNFMAIFAPAILKKVYEIRQPERLVEMAKLILEMIQSGHLLIYFNNQKAQDMLQQYNLDNAVRPAADGDFLMVVDSNIGFSKINLFIDHSMSYSINLKDPQKPTAAIRLKYLLPRPGTEPCQQGIGRVVGPDQELYRFVRCYWDYWRVLTMGNTTLTAAKFDPVPLEYFADNYKDWKNQVDIGPGENGTQMMGGLVVVPPQESKEVLLETRLPGSVVKISGNKVVYTLRVQKQAGIPDLPCEIQVVGPQGYTLDSSPDEWAHDPAQNLFAWKGSLTKTKDFQMEFVKKN